MPADPTLTAAVAAQAALRAAEAARYVAVVEWIDAHEVEGGGGGIFACTGHPVQAGGPGCPFVGEFDVYELGAALGLASSTMQTQVVHYGEIAHRLPRLRERVLAGEVSLWRACRTAEATVSLPWEGARWVDEQIAFCAERCSWTQLSRLVEAARAEWDPIAAKAAAEQAHDHRYVDVRLASPGDELTGVVEVHGLLDHADGLSLETALVTGAARLETLGSTDSLDVRRSVALGDLARGQHVLDLEVSREVVLTAHLDDSDVARLDHPGGRLALVDQIASWCRGATRVTITPVVDLRVPISTAAYAIPDRIREHVQLRHPTCAFPQCHRRAVACDLDHRVPWPQGRTSTDNLAPLCRRHHRLKTHGGWDYTYVDDDPGNPLIEPDRPRWVWFSPTGAVYESYA